MESDTYIVTKNFVLEDLKNILSMEILTNKLLGTNESVEVKIKNSRITILNFPEGINEDKIINLYEKLIEYKVNEVSLPEVVLVLNNSVKCSTVIKLPIHSMTDLVLNYYKLKTSPLHTLLTLTENQHSKKKWWQFWK